MWHISDIVLVKICPEIQPGNCFALVLIPQYALALSIQIHYSTYSTLSKSLARMCWWAKLPIYDEVAFFYLPNQLDAILGNSKQADIDIRSVTSLSGSISSNRAQCFMCLTKWLGYRLTLHSPSFVPAWLRADGYDRWCRQHANLSSLESPWRLWHKTCPVPVQDIIGRICLRDI